MSQREREDHCRQRLMELVVASRKALCGVGWGGGPRKHRGETPSGWVGRVNSGHTFKLVGGVLNERLISRHLWREKVIRGRISGIGLLGSHFGCCRAV